MAFSVATHAAEKKAVDPAKMEEAVRVQVFLDRANFGPGKIDGHLGDFTEKALNRYRAAKGGVANVEPAPGDAPKAEPPKAESGGLRGKKAEDRSATPDFSDLDLKSIEPVFVDYTVTDADVKAVGECPKKPEEQAKLKWLPYASVAEAVAERFHMDVDFIEQLNPGKTKDLKAGDVVRVPNVEPFDLQTVKEIKPGSAVQAKAANELGDESEPAEDAPKSAEKGKKDTKGKKDAKEDKEEAASTAKMSVVVTKGENMLEVMEDGKLVAAFPVTVGSEETASPMGEWKVKGVAKLPNFRYDKKMLKEGERSDDFHMIPPGPNNPVGVIWVALNKKGVGLHGSDSPDAIGRNQSHGCIRLANWDVVKLATMVKTGVPVTIR